MADTVTNPAERLKVFISYARADGAALAEELVTGLELVGFAPFLDRHDIAAAEDWEARLGGLIQTADTIVFIISPAAVKSERCAWEVDRAADLGKRLIPIQLVQTQGDAVLEANVPERLRRLNYVFFREGQSSPSRPTASALSPAPTTRRQGFGKVLFRSGRGRRGQSVHAPLPDAGRAQAVPSRGATVVLCAQPVALSRSRPAGNAGLAFVPGVMARPCGERARRRFIMTPCLRGSGA